jgi:probable HAF family extracellular repeat protein
MVGLGLLPGDPVGAGSIAFGTSADGTVVVGQSGLLNKAFRWTAASGMLPLGGPVGETVFTSSASDVSAAGTVIVGSITTSLAPLPQAFRRTNESGVIRLGGLEGTNRSSAHAVSADGSTVVGGSDSNPGRQAFRWTAQNGMVGLGDLPGGTFSSTALDVSGDGTVVVGVAETNTGREAMFWIQTTGMVNLRSFLVSQGVNLAGWTLTSAEGISADGRTIVGTGVNPVGNQEAWVATIPESSTLAFTLSGAGALLWFYSRAKGRNRAMHNGEL